jgi:hypothetical protein
VPNNSDKKLLFMMLNVAFERGILTSEEKIDLQKRLFTHKEMVNVSNEIIGDLNKFEEFIQNREIVEPETSYTDRLKNLVGW